jgi:hypothetical protein
VGCRSGFPASSPAADSARGTDRRPAGTCCKFGGADSDFVGFNGCTDPPVALQKKCDILLMVGRFLHVMISRKC